MKANYPITLSPENSNHVRALLTVLDDQFRKVCGDPINISKTLANEDFKKLLDDNRFVDRQEDRRWVINFIENIITKDQRFSCLYFINEQSRKNDEFALKISRKNKYPNVKNSADLKRLIDNNPGGLEVNDELLRYTYKKVEEDLKRLHKENAFRKLIRQKGQTQYFVFPKKEEQDMEIFQNKYDEYNYQWYLELCAKINAVVPEKVLPQQGRKSRERQRNLPDPNYELDNYAEMKAEWEKKNAKK